MNFNSRQFAQVIESALALSSDSARWQKAVERAADGLRSGSIEILESPSGAFVKTENGSYLVKGATCQCPAYQHGKQPCKHRSAVRLQEIYRLALLDQRIEESRKIETREIEQDWRGNKYKVVRYDGWMI